MSQDVFQLSPRITILPVVHGSGDMAVEIRRRLLEGNFDLLAVPLPPSFQLAVEEAVEKLPSVTAVVQMEMRHFRLESDADEHAESADGPRASYVPIDPCQPVIAALRFALGDRLPRAYVDLETARYEAYSAVLPDPFALKKASLEQFAAAVLPTIDRPTRPQRQARIAHMAEQLRRLERRKERIVMVCSLLDWPWLREAYFEKPESALEHDDVEDPRIFSPDPQTLIFMLGELPYITGLYERARNELESDERLSIDGVKELVVAARNAYKADLKKRARSITPHMLRLLLRYVRNLCLVERRLTPDLYTLVIGAKQIGGDQFALHVAETARRYDFERNGGYPGLPLGVDKGRIDGEIVSLVSRLERPPVEWRSCQLQKRPDRKERQDWKMGWNPYSQCSYPPEDVKIEEFRTRVADRAQALLSTDLAKTEKFSTSLKDGLDIRETLRNWHTGELYVRTFPPARGRLDCVVMLFDPNPDPREYPWRTTWFAEHQNESTLAFFATDFRKELVGPGIGLATYGGAMFLFPPRPIRNIWFDKKLDFTDTLEDRLLAAAAMHAECRHIAVM
ncbi:MAG TPA: hypothetical protein VGE52_00525, partial [Pirellulales bacterium]